MQKIIDTKGGQSSSVDPFASGGEIRIFPLLKRKAKGAEAKSAGAIAPLYLNF
jgi:hypothetical protein